jgi:hypothetical protein
MKYELCWHGRCTDEEKNREIAVPIEKDFLRCSIPLQLNAAPLLVLHILAAADSL